VPGAGIPGLPEAGAQDTRAGRFIQGDRAVIDNGQAAVEEHGFIAHQVHFIVGEPVLVQPSDSGVVGAFLPVTGDEDMVSPGFQPVQKGFCFRVGRVDVLVLVDDFQRPEQVPQGNKSFPEIPVTPLGGRGHIGVEGFQLFPQHGGEVPEGVVNVHDDFFHGNIISPKGKRSYDSPHPYQNYSIF
jgi:hypothetical protein